MNCSFIPKLHDFMIEGEGNDLVLYLVQDFGGNDLSKIMRSSTYYDDL